MPKKRKNKRKLKDSELIVVNAFERYVNKLERKYNSNSTKADINLVNKSESCDSKSLDTFTVQSTLTIYHEAKFGYIDRWYVPKKIIDSFPNLKPGREYLFTLKHIKDVTVEILKIDSPIKEKLRQDSDMRTKYAWRKLLWFIPSIEAIYKERDELTKQTGIPHEVDHIHPITHPRLCGLTVPWNLQVIPAIENKRKSNKLE